MELIKDQSLVEGTDIELFDISIHTVDPARIFYELDDNRSEITHSHRMGGRWGFSSCAKGFSAKAISNAIKLAGKSVRDGVCETMARQIGEFKLEEKNRSAR